jgi:predicted nuclease of predicted toxin-antitoxin system
MQFKIDENLPVEVANLLRQAEHNTATVLEQSLGGAADAQLAEICQQEKRAILTLDLDFSDIRTYPPDQYSGIVVLRLRRHDKPHVLQIVQKFLQAIETESPVGKLWIIDEKRIRIRE